MKVAVIYSTKYNEYEDLVQTIINKIDKETGLNYNRKIETEYITHEFQIRKKYDMYILLSDDIEDFELNFSKIKYKTNIILITKNLSESYISKVIVHVRDIIYAKNNIDTIMKRINKSICIKR